MGRIKDRIVKALPLLSTVIPEEKILRCSCGSAAFFDWGVKLLSTISFGQSPRYQDFAQNANVNICAECNRPAIQLDGDLYDASEYVSAEQVRSIIAEAQARQHTVPAKVMDP